MGKIRSKLPNLYHFEMLLKHKFLLSISTTPFDALLYRLFMSHHFVRNLENNICWDKFSDEVGYSQHNLHRICQSFSYKTSEVGLRVCRPFPLLRRPLQLILQENTKEETSYSFSLVFQYRNYPTKVNFTKH